MKSFKIYLKEGGIKSQLIWVGALLVIISITILAVSIYNYFTIPQEMPEEFMLSPQALIIKEFYISGALILLGIILLLAGAFAAPVTKDGEQEKQGQNK